MKSEQMQTRSVNVLLFVGLLNWTTGNGLFPLLPLYALERGMTVESTGMVLAAGFAALAVGSMAAAGLTRVVGSHKRTYVAAALLQALAYTLLGRATGVGQIVLLLACAWLGAGIAATTLQVMAGLVAGAERRGRVFGLLALAPPVGAVVGASLLGAIAAQSGYRLAFDSGAVLVLGAGLLMAFGMPAGEARKPEPSAKIQHVHTESRAFIAELVLLLGALLASTALSFGRLVTPVMMHALSFDPQAIAATTAVGGLVTAVFVPVIGVLSDRLGRRAVLIGTYGLIAVASSVLVFADQFWQFSLASSLLSLGFAGGAVSAALAGDMVSPVHFPRALGRLSTSTWLAAVIAFGGGGALLGHVAAPALCLLAALLAVGAGLSIVGLGWAQRQAASLVGARRDPTEPARQQA